MSSQLLVIILILALAVVLAAGGLLLSRRSARGGTVAPPRPPAAPHPPVPPEVPPAPEAPVEVLPPEVVEAPAVEEPVREKPRLRDRVSRTRAALGGAFAGITSRHRVDDETWDDLEEALILADVGVGPTTEILAAVRERAAEQKASDPDAVLSVLKEELVARLAPGDRTLAVAPVGPTVWMFVGVNGVGKTTSIAKLAQQEVEAGNTVVLAAADTFRAAAAEQLATWGERVGADVVRGQEGADPGSVVFDAMSAASNRSADRVLVDTAGRLHTKVNLMNELEKLQRIVERTPGALREVLLVVDATTGQNGLAQARQFADAVAVSGVVLTKLDGTAKGGIVLAIQSELGIPVKVVGIGESAEDLVPFDPVEFVDAIF